MVQSVAADSVHGTIIQTIIQKGKAMIFENAWRSVRRRTGYSLLLVIVFTVITAAVVVSLAIMQAAQTAKASGLANQSVTATISMNRSQIIKDAAGSASSDSSGDSSAREAARTAMNDMQLTLADYETYATAAGSLLTGTYYSQTAGLTAVDGQAEPVSSSSSSSDAASSSSSDSAGSDSAQSGQPSDGGQGFGGRGAESPMSSSDFTVVGLSNDEALANLGITVSSGEAVATGTVGHP